MKLFSIQFSSGIDEALNLFIYFKANSNSTHCGGVLMDKMPLQTASVCWRLSFDFETPSLNVRHEPSNFSQMLKMLLLARASIHQCEKA